jgi:hypothetical protein
MAEQF